jgi:virulence-associated protein VagC
VCLRIDRFGLPICIDAGETIWHIHGICKGSVRWTTFISGVREARLFRNNRSQAVRIPAEFEFSGNRVLIHKEGDKLIIEPEPKANLVDISRLFRHSRQKMTFLKIWMQRCSLRDRFVSMRYMLDTNIVSDLVRNPQGRIFNKIAVWQ